MKIQMLIKREFHGIGSPFMVTESRENRALLEAFLDANLGKYANVTIEVLDDQRPSLREQMERDVHPVVKERDPLFDKAVEVVKREFDKGQVITTNGLRLRVKPLMSYSRTSALIDQLEEAGLISCAKGGKPRKVL